MKAVNLLPRDQRASAPLPAAGASKTPSSGGAFGAWLVLGALAFVLVAVAGYVVTANQIKDREAELAATKAETDNVNRRVAALKPFADFQQMAVSRVVTVTALANSRFDWEKALADMSKALPSDVRLESVTGQVGSREAGAAAATTVPTIDLVGCTDSQTKVARLMARLRNVRGATRVSLKSSAKPAVTSTGAAAPSTSGPQGSRLCKKNRAAKFTVTMYFERATQLPGTSSAPGAAGAAGQGPTGPQGSAGTAPIPSTASPQSTGGTTTQGVSAP